MKLLLVATNRMMTPFPVYPIGVDYVATALRDHHEVRVMDLACDDADATLTASCRDWQPDFVGLSIRNIDNVERRRAHRAALLRSGRHQSRTNECPGQRAGAGPAPLGDGFGVGGDGPSLEAHVPARTHGSTVGSSGGII